MLLVIKHITAGDAYKGFHLYEVLWLRTGLVKGLYLKSNGCICFMSKSLLKVRSSNMLSAFYSVAKKVLCSSPDFKILNYFCQEQCIKLLLIQIA